MIEDEDHAADDERPPAANDDGNSVAQGRIDAAVLRIAGLIGRPMARETFGRSRQAAVTRRLPRYDLGIAHLHSRRGARRTGYRSDLTMIDNAPDSRYILVKLKITLLPAYTVPTQVIMLCFLPDISIYYEWCVFSRG
jgi:hypothetical protein